MKTPVYLDNNATTPVDSRVFEAMKRVFETQFGNASSTTHRHGWEAEELVTLARERVADLIGASTNEIYFTSGATESNNIAILGYCQRHASDDKNTLITSAAEHRAVLEPLEYQQELGRELSVLTPGTDGVISTQQLSDAISQSSLLISLMYGNNEIGSINDIPALSALSDTAFHCDATQAVSKIAIDVKQLGVEMLSFSAHKFGGPKGVGALYIKNGVSIASPFSGGGQEKGVRPGTLNVPGIVGLGMACELAKKEHIERTTLMKALTASFWEQITTKISGLTLNGPELEKRLAGNLNFSVEDVDAAALMGELSNKISISSTSACSASAKKDSHVLKAIGLSKEQQKSSVRIGISWCNTEEEIDFAVVALTDAVNKIRG